MNNIFELNGGYLDLSQIIGISGQKWSGRFDVLLNVGVELNMKPMSKNDYDAFVAAWKRVKEAEWKHKTAIVVDENGNIRPLFKEDGHDV